MIRKQYSFLLVVGILVSAACPSFAGLAHTGSSVVCSDCHTAHYSQQHNFRGGPTDLVKDPTGPFRSLLKASANNLCLACHDGSGVAPDVLTNPSNDYFRQAGGLNEAVGASGYNAWKGHTLGSKEVAPGGTWASADRGLACVDCHDPHGKVTQYRNLRVSDTPGDKFQDKSVTFVYSDTNNLTKDVWLHGGYDAAHKFGVEGVSFNEPDPTRSRYGEWCASCHGNFHGAGGSANMGSTSGGDDGSAAWRRHPAADVNMGSHGEEFSSMATFQSHTNRTKVMSSSGNWDSGTDLTPSCFSCHKAHGNKNAFGLIYMAGTGTVTEEGDTGGRVLEDLCRQCHSQ